DGPQTHNITMDSDKSVTAYCSVPSYNLTVDVNPGGSGNVTVNGTTPLSYPNTTTWVCGDSVTLNATAAANYSFDHWSGSLNGSANPTNITVDSDKSVTAHFSAIGVTYNLTVNVTPGVGGDIEVNSVAPGSYPNTYTFNDSELVNLNAVPAGGYSFVNWTGNLTGNTTPTNIIMDSDKSVTANFAVVPTHNLTTSSTAGGNVTTPGEGTYTYNASEVVALVATPDTNFSFVNWTGNVGMIDDVNSATTNITMNGNYSIVANFAEIPAGTYNLTTSSTAGGNVTTPGEGTYTYNASEVVALVATPDTNFSFVNWTGNVGMIDDVNSATTNITMNGNYSIVANFAEIPAGTYNLTTSSTAGGNVTTPGEATYTYNASEVVALVATPDTNYSFVNWTGDV
ncbi:unnamed protein product, partial [marine sediment metagenome]